MSLRQRKERNKRNAGCGPHRTRSMPASGNLAMANTRSTKVPKGWEEFYTALAGVTDRFARSTSTMSTRTWHAPQSLRFAANGRVHWPAEIYKPGDAPSFTRWGKSTS